MTVRMSLYCNCTQCSCQAGLLSPLVPTILPRTASCHLTMDGNPNPTETGSANCQTWDAVNISRLEIICIFGDFICLTICADRLADDQLYSEMPYAIDCYSSECNRDCYLLHYIIKTDHEFVISYSISTLDTLLLFMGGLQNLWSHWIIIPLYVSIHFSIKHYIGKLDWIFLTCDNFP